MLLNSNDLDFNGFFTIGLRFDVCAPAGATVLSSSLTVIADDGNSTPTTAEMWGEYSGNAATFSSQTITSRTRTSASTSWPAFSTWVPGTVEVSPDLNSILTEILAHPGWTGCGNIVLIIEGTGNREAVSHNNNPADAPELTFTYQF